MDEDRGADVPAGDESRGASRGIAVHAILSSLGVFLVVVLFLGIVWYNARENNDKVREMTRICVEAGYQGWADEDDTWGDSSRSGCYK